MFAQKSKNYVKSTMGFMYHAKNKNLDSQIYVARAKTIVLKIGV